MAIPEKYKEIWEKAEPLLKQGRPGDDAHAMEVVGFILNCGMKDLDLDVLIPTAIMHDIGHSAILPEHFKYITGQERVVNGKLVHMLVGAKIVRDILSSVQYDSNKADEIVDIVSMHDAYQLQDVDLAKIYDTDNKKIFHDADSMDAYNADRLKKMEKLAPDRNKMFGMLEKGLNSFFYPEFRKIAEERLGVLKAAETDKK